MKVKKGGENYSAWRISSSEFPGAAPIADKIRFLLGYGVLAPSVHNTQPWLFKVSGNTLEVYADLYKKLPYGDHSGRCLFVSVGCCLENILVAAADFGLISKLFLESADVDANTENGQCLVARIVFEDDQGAVPAVKYSEYISKHSMTKLSFDKRVDLPVKFVSKFESVVNEWRVSGFMSQDNAVINNVARLVAQASQEAFSNFNFRKEMSGWLRNNFTAKYEGMPLFTNGIPAPVSFFAPLFIKWLNPSAVMGRKAQELILSASAVVVLGASNRSIGSCINMGRVFQHLDWLAFENNLSLAIMDAPIEIGRYHEEITKLLSLDFEPLLFFRVGHRDKVGLSSPRRPADHCMIN